MSSLNKAKLSRYFRIACVIKLFLKQSSPCFLRKSTLSYMESQTVGCENVLLKDNETLDAYMTFKQLPVCASQIKMLSPIPETISEPSWLKVADLILPVCWITLLHMPFCTSQIRTVLSLLAETTNEPIWLKNAELTYLMCPSRTLKHTPVFVSQIRTVLSSLAETTNEPS